MKGTTRTDSIVTEETVSKIQDIGFFLLRYGLVLVIVWIGGMKATEYEAKNIARLIARSPLLSWGIASGQCRSLA